MWKGLVRSCLECPCPSFLTLGLPGRARRNLGSGRCGRSSALGEHWLWAWPEDRALHGTQSVLEGRCLCVGDTVWSVGYGGKAVRPDVSMAQAERTDVLGTGAQGPGGLWPAPRGTPSTELSCPSAPAHCQQEEMPAQCGPILWWFVYFTRSWKSSLCGISHFKNCHVGQARPLGPPCPAGSQCDLCTNPKASSRANLQVPGKASDH